MKLGARIFKTALAVVLSFYLAEWIGLPSGSDLFAAIAAVLAVQPSVYRSFNYMKEQIQSNIIGALFAILAVTFIGKDPIIIGIIIIMVILINIRLHFHSSITLSVLTVIALMGSQQAEHAQEVSYALIRFSSIMLGIVCALLVNTIFAPPKYEKTLLSKIKEINQHITFLLRNTLSSELEEKVYKEEKSKVEDDMKKLEEFYKLYSEGYNKGFKKVHYSKVRKLVVFKHLLKTTKLQLHALDTLEKNFFCAQQLHLTTEFQTHLDLLTNYYERILFKYEEKLKASAKHERDEEIIENSRALLETLMKNYKENGKEDDSWIYLFPVVSSFIDLSNQLDHTERLIDSLHSHHKK